MPKTTAHGLIFREVHGRKLWIFAKHGDSSIAAHAFSHLEPIRLLGALRVSFSFTEKGARRRRSRSEVTFRSFDIDHWWFQVIFRCFSLHTDGTDVRQALDVNSAFPVYSPFLCGARSELGTGTRCRSPHTAKEPTIWKVSLN